MTVWCLEYSVKLYMNKCDTEVQSVICLISTKKRHATRPVFPYGNIIFLNIFYEFCKTGGMKLFYCQTTIPLNFTMPYSKKFRSREFFFNHVTSESCRKSGNSSFPADFFRVKMTNFPKFCYWILYFEIQITIIQSKLNFVWVGNLKKKCL